MQQRVYRLKLISETVFPVYWLPITSSQLNPQYNLKKTKLVMVNCIYTTYYTHSKSNTLKLHEEKCHFVRVEVSVKALFPLQNQNHFNLGFREKQVTFQTELLFVKSAVKSLHQQKMEAHVKTEEIGIDEGHLLCSEKIQKLFFWRTKQNDLFLTYRK